MGFRGLRFKGEGEEGVGPEESSPESTGTADCGRGRDQGWGMEVGVDLPWSCLGAKQHATRNPILL